MDTMIKEFISTIQRGPFTCLRDHEGSITSEYITEQNADVGDIYDYAVYQAWQDVCRTVPGAGREKKEKCDLARKVAAAALRRYFAGKPKEKADAFDGWFASACSDVCAPAELTTGQGQKILNMAFKYLYCCEDIRSGHEKHFTCCHMPLDSYILRWYRENCAAKDYSGEVWSKINDIALYLGIQNEIREKLGGKDILLQEFSIYQAEYEKIEKRKVIAGAKQIVEYRDCPEGLRGELKKFVEKL